MLKKLVWNLLRRRGYFNDRDRLIEVKSWWPWIGPYGPEWPCLLVERGGHRRTTTPVWPWPWRKIFL